MHGLVYLVRRRLRATVEMANYWAWGGGTGSELEAIINLAYFAIKRLR